ncbi:MAG: thioredoxin [Pirellulaceae bacterium]|nr:thioredoxin [Planctomycetales bacterium]
MKAVHANDQTFDQVVGSSHVPVLIDFWAPWCGPCRAMSGVVDEVAEELGETARVVKVNVDEAAAVAQRFGVQAIPTFAVVQGGQLRQRFSGAVPKRRLLDAVQQSVN